jgi:transposase
MEATRWTGRPSSPHSRILYALAEPVEACRIRTVAMESTGVYRIPLFQILEGRGLKVYLVNAHSLKIVPAARVMSPTVSGFSICTR